METFIVFVVVTGAVFFLWRSLRKEESSCGCDGCAEHDCQAMMERLAEVMPPECTDNSVQEQEQKNQ